MAKNITVNGDTWKDCGVGAGGDDNIAGTQFSSAAVSRDYIDCGCAGYFCSAHDHRDVVFLHQKANPAGKAVGNLPAAFDRCGIVQFKVVKGETKILSAFAQGMGNLCIF